MIGITEGSIASRNYFYNDFISGILLNHDASTKSVLIEECKQMLDRVVIVNFEMTQADVVVYKRVSSVPIDILTGIGGLLSLYMGISFLSVVEAASFLLKPFAALLRFPTKSWSRA